MKRAFVLSRVTLIITIAAGVVQAKILYFISLFVLSPEREHAAFPIRTGKKENTSRLKISGRITSRNIKRFSLAYLP